MGEEKNNKRKEKEKVLLFRAMSQKKTPSTSMRWMGRVCLKVAQSLAEVNAAGVGRVAAVEGEQQIQFWEVKAFYFGCTARACAGD